MSFGAETFNSRWKSLQTLSMVSVLPPGLLRSVSRAVDLIMTHFGSSRDPEEKV